MNNEQTQNTKPFIFTKKINSKYKVIPLNITTNTLGPTRHFPPATKEWFNSIYSFNSNSIKNLSIADKNLIRLIKSYFNLFFNKSILKSKRIATRFKRLAVKKIFISKAELKHTNSKVVITLYVYNEERRILIRKIKRLEAILFPLSIASNFLIKQEKSNNKNKLLSIKEKLNIIKSQEDTVSLMSWLHGLKSYLIEQIKLEENNLLIAKKTKLLKDKSLIIENLNKDLVKIINIISICENDFVINKYYETMYKDFLYKTHLEKEINTIAYYKLLLNLNKSKFENKFLSKIKPLIAKFYNKEVEFNIVNLKTLYLNSDIFTEAISLKLKNRNNRLLQVLRSSLSMIKLPKVNRIREQYNKINIKELWVNKINNLNVNPLNSKYYGKDVLNKLLLDLFNNSSYIINKENDNLLLNFILNSLKHKNMAGARLEAKGRLTRRFTASRSVFKIKWKGSLKNIDSSYRGLSSVILRGHAKSNVQYSVVNSKTRNGAFGLKGWISSK
jgi:Mitochondrial ribosomal protein (VAR1)